MCFWSPIAQSCFSKMCFWLQPGSIFAKIWKRNAPEQNKYRTRISQITFLMQIRNNIWNFHRFASVILGVVLWIWLRNKKYTFFTAKIKILMGDRSRKKANRTGNGAISAKKMAHWSFLWGIQSTKKWIFEGWLLRVVFQKCASGCSGEHIFEKNWKNIEAKQKCKQKCTLQLAFLM